jgi:hypothetical protein
MQVKAVESISWELAVTGGLIKEIQELAHLNCVAFMVSFVPRSCNGIAHALAAMGCVCGEDDDPIVNHRSPNLYSDHGCRRECGR